MTKNWMRDIAAAAFVVIAVVLTAAAFGGGGGDDGGGEKFDWLTAENGRRVFRDGFATADSSLAATFVATGINAKTILLTLSGAEYRAVLRGGRYYSGEGNPDDSMDTPASAEVLSADGRRLFAAKGYKFTEARTEENAIVIRYYRGVMGCGLVDYHLQPAAQNLTLSKTQIISTKDYSPCQTE